MEQNIFLQRFFKITQCLCQLKNTFNILVALLGLIRENLMKYQKKILKIQLNKTAILHHLLYIFYKINPQLRNLNTNFTLYSCLFGSLKLTKNADVDKYQYSSYDIEFHSLLVKKFYLQMQILEKMSLFLELK